VARFLTKLLERTPLALVILGIAVVVLGASGHLTVSGVTISIVWPWDYGVAGLGIVCFAFGIGLVIADHRSGGGRAPGSGSTGQFGPMLAVSGYRRSHIPEFYREIERRIRSARKVRFISMGLQILYEGNILDILVQRAVNGDTEVTACMGNPYSPDVVDRLIHEETIGTRPQVGRHGIERNIRSLLDYLDRFNNPRNFRALLFQHYPTFSTYIVDQDVFVVPYMYQVLGWQAPVLHMKNEGNEIARFVVENAERLLDDAVPARDIFDSQPERRHRSDDWIQACIAIVPDADAPLARFGTDVVGFDVRSGLKVATTLGEVPNLASSIGDVAAQGFCAPLVEPLYFPNEAAIRHAVAELTVLSDELPRFELVNARIEDRSRSVGDIVVRCDDHSGVAEAIHAELVPRFCRRAVTSDYLSGRSRRQLTADAFAERNSLMIRRYGSPNVLNQFDVHFPICCDPPADALARKALTEGLAEACRDRVRSESLFVDRIHLLVRRPGAPNWQVLKVCGLG
jgi:hypothetical protein